MVFIRERRRGSHIYLEEVKSVRIDGKVKQVHMRYVGAKVDGKTVLSGSISRAEITKVTIHGPLLMLHKICKLLKIDEIIGKDSPYILALVYAHCIDPGSVSWIQKWYSRTDLNSLLNLEEVTYDKLLHSLDNIETRSMSIQRRMYDAAVEKFGLSISSMFYDVTNVYFYGCNCPTAKAGYNKQKMQLPQVQIGLAMTKEEKIPIFHRVFEGDIRDTRTMNDVMTTFRELDINNGKVTLVWDRGITSEKNLKDAKAMGCEVICGLPLSKTTKQVVERIIITNRSIGNLENRIPLKNSVLYAVQKRYNYHGVSGYLTLCLNKKDKLSRAEERRERIALVIDAKRHGKAIPTEWRKYIKYKNIDQESLDDVEKYDGISALFSTKKIPKDELIRAYFEKDIVEKTFRSMKSILEIRPIRHWLKNRVNAHILICYIAYYFLSIIEYKLKKMNFSACEALDILSTVYKVQISDPVTKNVFSKTVTLSKEQERILDALHE